VPFESLYFSDRKIIGAHLNAAAPPPEDVAYHRLLNLFSTPKGIDTPPHRTTSLFECMTSPTPLLTELKKLIHDCANDSLQPRDGTQFFREKYGVVDGYEAERVAALREWDKPPPPGSRTAFATSRAVIGLSDTLYCFSFVSV